MLDLVIIVATAIVGLLIIFFWVGWGSEAEKVINQQQCLSDNLSLSCDRPSKNAFLCDYQL